MSRYPEDGQGHETENKDGSSEAGEPVEGLAAEIEVKFKIVTSQLHIVLHTAARQLPLVVLIILVEQEGVLTGVFEPHRVS